jgi:hypothetical protein
MTKGSLAIVAYSVVAGIVLGAVSVICWLMSQMQEWGR